MAKFAFVVPPLTGHVNPTLCLGAALIERGHEVGWITLDGSLKPQLPPGGKLLLIEYSNEDHAKKESQQYLDMISQKNVYGIESIKFLYDDVLIPLNRYMFDGISGWIEKFAPDIVIQDHQLFAGAMAATKKSIPYVTSVTAPAAIQMREDLPKIHEWEMKKIQSLGEELGLHGDDVGVCSEWMTLVFTSREFFGDMPLPDHYQFVGPVIRHRVPVNPFDWEKFRAMEHPAKILISIGTTFDHTYKKDFFRKVIEALGNESLSVIVVSDKLLFDEWPDNFLVQERIPQIELLPHLDAVVCHGGHNTVCETLTHGLPLVVIPIAYDQSYVAGRVTRADAGLRLNFKRFRAGDLKKAVWEILTNGQYKEAAKHIQASFQRAGGAERAVMLLEDMIRKPKSVNSVAERPERIFQELIKTLLWQNSCS